LVRVKKKEKKQNFPADLFKFPGTCQVSCRQVDDHQLAGAWSQLRGVLKAFFLDAGSRVRACGM
jgi:hypothetical protein